MVWESEEAKFVRKNGSENKYQFLAFFFLKEIHMSLNDSFL